MGTGPLLAFPTRNLLPEEESCSSRDVSGAKDVPGSAVDELTRESPISGLGEARTDNTLQIKKTKEAGVLRAITAETAHNIDPFTTKRGQS